MSKRIDRLDKKAKYIERLYRALVAHGRDEVVLRERCAWDDHIVAGDARSRRIIRCQPDTDNIYGSWSYRDGDGLRLAGVIEREDDPGPTVAAVEKYLAESLDDTETRPETRTEPLDER